jgi:hypothetical protein
MDFGTILFTHLIAFGFGWVFCEAYLKTKNPQK